MKVATLTSAYNSLIIGPRGYGYEANLQEIMGWDFSELVIFDSANGWDDFSIGGNELASSGNDLVSGENELISGEEFSKWRE